MNVLTGFEKLLVSGKLANLGTHHPSLTGIGYKIYAFIYNTPLCQGLIFFNPIRTEVWTFVSKYMQAPPKVCVFLKKVIFRI